MENKPSLFKQLSGALIGSAVALAIYYAYQYSAPLVTAYISLPSGERQFDLGDVNVAEDSVSENKLKRIQSRNEQIANTLKAQDPAQYKLDEDVWDTAWPEDVFENTEPAHEAAPEEPQDLPATQDDGWEDFIRSTDTIPLPTGVEVLEEASVTTHSSAPELPNSGFGVTALLATAFGAVGGRTLSKKKKIQ